jgi:hypothetical protein
MMRWVTLGLMICTLAGCASQPAPAIATTAAQPIYDDAIAAALVYDPPVIANSPHTDFSREGRAQAAYGGFEELITTYYYLRVDDRQLQYGGGGGLGHRGGNFDRFERQAITERVGVSYR